ncbi:SAM-dependent methyltransferase [Plantactinospora sp. GCM10030261]|uniref:SAM-dependent methyltransferase n=1 Tax=Plantactinospora sp. GCM10030261 TaxID=3273420 RepID=UPI00361F45F0
MASALYGPGGFFTTGPGPAAHFRTSVHAGPIFVSAILRLLQRVDATLGHPDRLDLVDVGAGRGELLAELARQAAPALANRLRLTAVELAARPGSLPGGIEWRSDLPTGVTGLLLATEWLDNVPLDVAGWGPAGWRRILVEPATGAETAGGPLDPAEAAWLADWWPAPAASTLGPATPAMPGPPDDLAGPCAVRAEIGLHRDLAWADAVRSVHRGLAVAVDYGHLRAGRPAGGTLTAYRAGRQVPPVPDGSCDLTAHVAVDAVAAAGQEVAGTPYTLVRQREALRTLGVDGARPPLTLASSDPAGYVRALAAASTAAELVDRVGLGDHWWLCQPVGIEPSADWARTWHDDGHDRGDRGVA